MLCRCIESLHSEMILHALSFPVRLRYFLHTLQLLAGIGFVSLIYIGKLNINSTGN
jgi:hypothetical protein